MGRGWKNSFGILKMNRPNLKLNGLLPIDKDSGVFSKDVSRYLESIFGKISLGHVGTLDPLAEGVLPILLGKATRLQDILLDGIKEYEFDVQFGIETNTLDCKGHVIQTAKVPDFDDAKINHVLQNFCGDILQVAPVFSSIKINGVESYKLARKPNPKPALKENAALVRKVKIYHMHFLNRKENTATFFVRCSKGTYVRALGRDIAYALNTLGTISRIVRHETAFIRKENCLSFSALRENPSIWEKFYIPIEKIYLDTLCMTGHEPDITKKLMQGHQILINPAQKSPFVFNFNFEERLNYASRDEKVSENIEIKNILFKDVTLGLVGLAKLVAGVNPSARASVKMTRSLM